jgi:hypothetical protein
MNGIKLQTIPKYTILTDRKGEYLLTEKMNLCLANAMSPISNCFGDLSTSSFVVEI